MVGARIVCLAMRSSMFFLAREKSEAGIYFGNNCAIAIIEIMAALLRCICFVVCICGMSANVEREGSAALAVRGNGGAVVNYAEIRARVAHGFIEKANEMADAVAVLQDLSKASSGLSEQIKKHCPK